MIYELPKGLIRDVRALIEAADADTDELDPVGGDDDLSDEDKEKPKDEEKPEPESDEDDTLDEPDDDEGELNADGEPAEKLSGKKEPVQINPPLMTF